jgi:phage replication-related protein YjqB (UPF0714/DUF867 family)
MDRYKSFSELKRHEEEGVDFRIFIVDRKVRAAIIAPHGGWIEPGTSEIAAIIAGTVHSLYCFEGLRNRLHRDLHITSSRFDEPRCLALVASCDRVVAVHGLTGPHNSVEVGGLDSQLRDAVSSALKESGFNAEVVAAGDRAAINTSNICNRGRRKAGVQLEITRGLRDALLSNRQRMNVFADTVRAAIG